MIAGINKRLRAQYPELRGKRRAIPKKVILRAAYPQKTVEVTKPTGHGTVSVYRPQRISYRARRTRAQTRYIKRSVNKFRRFLIKNYRVMHSTMIYYTRARNNNGVFGNYAVDAPYAMGHIGYGMTSEQTALLTSGVAGAGVINTFPLGTLDYTVGTAITGNDIFFAMDWPGTRMSAYQNIDKPGNAIAGPWFGLLPQHRLDKPNVAFCYTDDCSASAPSSATDYTRWKVQVSDNPTWADPRADSVYVLGYRYRMKFTNIDWISWRVNIYTFVPSVGINDIDTYYSQLDRNFTTRAGADTNVGLLSLTSYLQHQQLPTKLYKKGTMKCRTFLLGPNKTNSYYESIGTNPIYQAVATAGDTENLPCVRYMTLKNNRMCKKIDRGTGTTSGSSTWTNAILEDKATMFRYMLIVAFPNVTLQPWTTSGPGLSTANFTGQSEGQYIMVNIEKKVKWCVKPSSVGSVAI